jgi:hypothetical protein
MALGALIIKACLGFTEACQYSTSFDPLMLVYLRKRLPETVVNGWNKRIVYHGLTVVRSASSQDVHDDDQGSGSVSNEAR